MRTINKHFFDLSLFRGNLHVTKQTLSFGNADSYSGHYLNECESDKKINSIKLTAFLSSHAEKDERNKNPFLNENFDKFLTLGNFFENKKRELISLNNYLYWQHKSFFEMAPPFSEKSPDLFSNLSKLYGEPSIEMSSDMSEVEWDEIFNDELSDLLNEEQDRWTTYANIYQAGQTAVAIIIFLEKSLNELIDELSIHIDNKNKYNNKKGKSVLDSKLQFLQQEFDLEFRIPPRLAQIIFDARIARNRFAHGDWNEIERRLANTTASNLIKTIKEIISLIFLSVFLKTKK